ncbi:MAG: hypothetical protein HZC54_13710 [Verrucomicrobia bacterium]|nr:hypothetical protein [Verrucomicrobiota bacterium]
MPQGPTASSYRISGYQRDLIGTKEPECDVLPPKWGSGLKWPDENNPQSDDLLWDGGVSGGVWWDGSLYRDAARYPAGGELFWCSYFKPGSAAGMNNGFWINFGHSFSHLHNDDPAQVLAGAAQRLSYDATAGQWVLVIQATQYVTAEVVEVWRGVKTGGNDPAGVYTRVSGCDPTATLSVEAL